MEGKITGVLYAVFRVDGKHKTLGSIRGFQKHMEREQNTPNADSTKTPNNRILIGNSNIYKLLKDNISDCKLRKNGNVATELLLTASREYFRNISPEQKEMWVEANVKFIKDRFKDGCIYAVLHEDETTPHIHALISQRAKDRWGNTVINNSIHFGGSKEVMRKWQDDYSGAMSEFNLSRGVKFSKATHVKLKQFYALLDDNLSTEKLTRMIDSAYRYNCIKEEYEAVVKQLEAFKGISNTDQIKRIQREIYKLSTLTTAPDKFYNVTLENEKRNEIKKLLMESGIELEYSLDSIQREAKNRRRETSTEAYARIVAETQIKREVLELKKLLRYMNSEGEVRSKDLNKAIDQVKRLEGNERIYKGVIRSLGEYYSIPQQVVNEVVKNVRKEAEKKTSLERTL